MGKLPWLSLALVFIAGCGAVLPTSPPAPTPRPSARPPGPGEVAVPVELWEPVNGIPVLCGGVGFEGESLLHGSATDPRVVWMTYPDGSRHELAWPRGYSARFAPAFELLDERGVVVGREGTLVMGGCGTPKPGVEWVELESLRPEATLTPATAAPSAP